MIMKKKIYQISLGCPKNLVDSEIMLGLLYEGGYITCQEAEEADVLLVNTCGFIQDAVEEAIDTILDLVRIKHEFPHKKIVVTGCLVQRYRESLLQELPEVDLFLGTEGVPDIVNQVDDLLGSGKSNQRLIVTKTPFLMKSTLPRIISTPPHRAYLKVTEGCANRCSYCMIPSIRGNLRSRPIDDLVDEAKRLEAQGVKEITLVAQDLTSYGRDRGLKGDGLEKLLEALLEGCAIPWVRLLYLYPVRVNRGLLRLIKREDRILPYLDIPLQHVSSKILKAMNRPYQREDIDQLIALIRQELPEAALRTTFMVGFPGENEDDVAQLEEFIRAYQFSHVGIFAYSNEEGCAAENFPDQCDDTIKEERLDKLMQLQSEVALRLNTKKVGTIEKVLVEGLSRETDLLLEGRSKFQAPEIDGCVYINDGVASPGDFVDVRITEAHPYDLVGEIIAANK